MEEEASINFKTLRAKFQEEALHAQSKCCRPTVAEKPKHLPPAAGSLYSSVVSTNNVATSTAPQVFHREGLQASGGKRPISFPPQPSHTPFSLLCSGECTKKNLLKDRSLPLVLPFLPRKDQRMDLQATEELTVKDALQQTRIKKGLLLPFKSTKALKVTGEMGEEGGSHSGVTIRTCTTLGDISSEDKTIPEDGNLDPQTTDSVLSSPDVPVTTPPAEAVVECDNIIMSTLEKARKKFSSRQKLICARPKSLLSPDYCSKEKEFPSPPKTSDGVWPDLPLSPPLSLPHLSCISARPFFKASTSARKPLVKDLLAKDKPVHPAVKIWTSFGAPKKKPLPDHRALGPKPAKPTRPPSLDLSGYRAPSRSEVSPSQAPREESQLLPVPPFVPDVPEFPNFEMESAVNIAALELDALDFDTTDFPSPVDTGPSSGDGPQSNMAVCITAEPSGISQSQDPNQANLRVLPLHSDSFHEPINLSDFPELGLPERWSPTKEALVNSCLSHPDETHAAAAPCQAFLDEAEQSSCSTQSDEIQKHPSVYPHNRCFETCDNVYEDVENVNKGVFNQRTCKPHGSVKKAYAVNNTMKQDAGVYKRPRNPWGSVSGEHASSGHNHTPSKEHQSPNTADYKEQKKREKQRLGKERKEQKEREKKENEMKKKFKVTGEEEPMYHAKVMVASKVRKHDLPVKSGDTVSIIRTTNCPKGKWLARDTEHKYGYISVMNVELNIQEMLELGKKAQAAGRGANAEGDNISIESRSSSHPVLTSSFTDDSEEWACEDETISPSIESHSFSQLTTSVSETSCSHVSSYHTLSDINLEDMHTQTRNDALQKLAIFFQHNKNELSEADGATPTKLPVCCGGASLSGARGRL
ncbi:uncharacterized protein LOC114479485 isoform X2 [Gouania willdenowi]|uniref:uncharacterized protein LOC114479485 isoform X2 n=1 Tax=Gouania willdenowi TaxID=441366 RepID=UPI0010557C79|nr:uncharacterized protein LOC114479485 isoform X2 [Gouania willdenowi]